MKLKIFILCAATIFLTAFVKSQTTSTITYDAGASLEIQFGADVCATNVIINGTFSGGGTICSGPLPVELLSFTSSVYKNNVKLEWETAFELNNSGFDIERALVTSTGTGAWHISGFVQGNGTTNEPKQYRFEDINLKAATYKYRIRQIDYNGGYEYFNLDRDVHIEPPKIFSMGQNFPNPSNPKSKINYEIPVNSKVTIRLFDILGQEFINIVNETKEAGYYTVEFDGSNLASGVYFYRIIAEGNGINYTRTMKMVIVK